MEYYSALAKRRREGKQQEVLSLAANSAVVSLTSSFANSEDTSEKEASQTQAAISSESIINGDTASSEEDGRDVINRMKNSITITPKYIPGSSYLKYFTGYGVWEGRITSFDGQNYHTIYDDGYVEIFSVTSMEDIMMKSDKLIEKKVRVATTQDDQVGDSMSNGAVATQNSSKRIRMKTDRYRPFRNVKKEEEDQSMGMNMQSDGKIGNSRASHPSEVKSPTTTAKKSKAHFAKQSGKSTQHQRGNDDYIGVHKSNKKYASKIYRNRKEIYLGSYSLQVDAALAWDKANDMLDPPLIGPVPDANFTTLEDYERAKKLELNEVGLSSKLAMSSGEIITKVTAIISNHSSSKGRGDGKVSSSAVQLCPPIAWSECLRRTEPNRSDNYNGICLSKNTQRWKAQIFRDKKKVYLGSYILRADAALAWDKANAMLDPPLIGPVPDANFTTLEDYERAKKLELNDGGLSSKLAMGFGEIITKVRAQMRYVGTFDTKEDVVAARDLAETNAGGDVEVKRGRGQPVGSKNKPKANLPNLSHPKLEVKEQKRSIVREIDDVNPYAKQYISSKRGTTSVSDSPQNDLYVKQYSSSRKTNSVSENPQDAKSINSGSVSSAMHNPEKKRGGGRPKGSKNKPRNEPRNQATNLADKKRIDAAVRTVNVRYGSGAERKRILSATTFRGVTCRPSGKWQAQVFYAGKSRYIGVFQSKEQAALAYEAGRELLENNSEGGDVPDGETIASNVALARKAAFAIPDDACVSNHSSSKGRGSGKVSSPAVQSCSPIVWSECLRRTESSQSDKFNGISLSKNTQRWKAQIFRDKKKVYLGSYILRADAALAWDKANAMLDPPLIGPVPRANFANSEHYERAKERELNKACLDNNCAMTSGGIVTKVTEIISNHNIPIAGKEENIKGNPAAQLKSSPTAEKKSTVQSPTARAASFKSGGRSTDYHGVCKLVQTYSYTATIYRDKKSIHLGSYSYSVDAALAYDTANSLFGGSHRLNFANLEDYETAKAKEYSFRDDLDMTSEEIIAKVTELVSNNFSKQKGKGNGHGLKEGDHVWVKHGRESHAAVILSIHRGSKTARVRWSTMNTLISEVEVRKLSPMFNEKESSSSNKRQRQETTRYAPPERPVKKAKVHRSPSKSSLNTKVTVNVLPVLKKMAKEEADSNFLHKNLGTIKKLPSGVSPGPGWTSNLGDWTNRHWISPQMNIKFAYPRAAFKFEQFRRQCNGNEEQALVLYKRTQHRGICSLGRLGYKKKKDKPERFDEALEESGELSDEPTESMTTAEEQEYNLLWDYYMKPIVRVNEEVPSGMILRQRTAMCNLLRFKYSRFRRKLHKRIISLEKVGRKHEIYQILKELKLFDSSLDSGDGPSGLMDQILGPQHEDEEVQLLDKAATALVSRNNNNRLFNEVHTIVDKQLNATVPEEVNPLPKLVEVMPTITHQSQEEFTAALNEEGSDPSGSTPASSVEEESKSNTIFITVTKLLHDSTLGVGVISDAFDRIKVKRIELTGIFAFTELRVGDIVQSINGKNYSYNKGTALLKNAKGKLTIEVSRSVVVSPTEEMTNSETASSTNNGQDGDQAYTSEGAHAKPYHDPTTAKDSPIDGHGQQMLEDNNHSAEELDRIDLNEFFGPVNEREIDIPNMELFDPINEEEPNKEPECIDLTQDDDAIILPAIDSEVIIID